MNHYERRIEEISAQVWNLFQWMESREFGSTLKLAREDMSWPRRVVLPCGTIITEV